MIQPTSARDAALAQATELAREEFWQFAFARAVPRLPLLVKNLTKTGGDYYLVDFRTDDVPTGRMILDPETGRANQVTGADYEDGPLPEFIPPEEVLGRLDRLAPHVDLDDGRRVDLPQDSPPHVDMVWAHTIESRTMFQPFHRLRWTQLTLFWRIDGKFFDRLTQTDSTASTRL